MRNTVRNFRTILISGISCAAIAACAPSSHMSAHDVSAHSSYGYSQSAYGYETSQTATTYKSRYGGELRGASCDVVVQSCGMMAVVPVYPVFQVITAPYEPEIKIVEVPVEVEVPVYIQPETPVPPVIDPPVRHWPDPETPVIPWTPPRK